MAATIAVGYELGAGREKDAVQYSYISRIVAIVVAIAICGFTFTNMESISSLFTNDEEVYNLIYRFLWLWRILCCHRCNWNTTTRYLTWLQGCKNRILYLTCILLGRMLPNSLYLSQKSSVWTFRCMDWFIS